MDYRWIGVLVTVFIGLTLICSIMQGTGFISDDDVEILNQQGITQDVKLGFISVPIPGGKYINGIIRLMDFKEYNDIIFTGYAQIIYFAMAGIAFVIGFTLFLTVVGLGVNAIRGR